MTLLDRLRLWLRPTGRDIGDHRYGEALVDVAIKQQLDAEAMADEWANEGGCVTEFKPLWDGGTPPAGTVPNCS